MAQRRILAQAIKHERLGQKTVVKPTPVQKLDTNRTFSLEFEAKEPLDKVEFRLHVSTKSDFALSNIALTRLA